jgi:hypothetical protein
MMLRTPVCSYPIIVSHLRFNVLCLLILFSIYLSGRAGPQVWEPIHGLLKRFKNSGFDGIVDK